MPAPITPPKAAAPTIDHVAAFLASADAADDGAPLVPAPSAEPRTPTLDPDDDEPADPAVAAPALVTASAPTENDALLAALKSKDAAAFLEALGDDADSLLGAPAHAAIRIAAKDVREKLKTAVDTEKRTELLSEKLEKKYGDAITVRKLATERADGNIDGVLDIVERWTGLPWLEFQKWVAKGLSGRPERLVAKEQVKVAESTATTAAAAKAAGEVTAWADGIVKKADPELHKAHPGLTGLVVAKMREKFKDGVTTPAAALKLVKADLRAQVEAMAPVFAKTRKAREPVITEVAERSTRTPQRKQTLEETIAETSREWSRTNASR